MSTNVEEMTVKLIVIKKILICINGCSTLDECLLKTGSKLLPVNDLPNSKGRKETVYGKI